MFMKALRELQQALDFMPGDPDLTKKINELRKEIN
jgi:hypothetical protein